MADIRPDLDLRKKQLQIRVLELQLNLQRMDFRLMELDAEKAKISENTEATNKALAELQKEIGG